MQKILILLVFLVLRLFAQEDSKPIVRIANISIDCYTLKEYKVFLKECSENSLRLESGVLMLYPMWEEKILVFLRFLKFMQTSRVIKNICKLRILKNTSKTFQKWLKI